MPNKQNPNSIKLEARKKDYHIPQLSKKQLQTLKHKIQFQYLDVPDAWEKFLEYQADFVNNKTTRIENQIKYKFKNKEAALTKAELLHISKYANLARYCYRKPEIELEYKEKLKTLKSKLELKEACQKGYILYIPTINGVKNYNDYWLKPNEYPYFVDKDIQHFVIWNFEGKKISQNVVNTAIKYLSKIGPNDVKWQVNWTNPTLSQSVPEYNHLHLFISYK